MNKAVVATKENYKVDTFEWGDLTWFVNAQLGNSTTLTVGRCVLKPGCANPRHHHPNCDEVLHVLQGKIMHTMEGGKRVEMSAGDTISIPINVPHNATNLGNDDAVLLICFSSAQRQTIGETE